jgi:predicted transcriptional regulator with HTH domain
MKKLIFLPLLLLLFSCKEEITTSWMTIEKANSYFRDIEEICNQDSGKLWNKNLYGNILLIDRTSRSVFSNFPDEQGLLKGKDGVYTGTYPKELIINITPVSFGGTKYAMVPLPAVEDTNSVRRRAIHSLFHCFQETMGVDPVIYNQRNMEDREARLWIKLEWKALRKAIASKGDERLRAIRDALVFRGANRELYSNYADDANHFETYEGLATFTYFKLCTANDEEFRKRILEYLDRIYGMSSYARSYGAVHGALYASLLYEGGYDLKLLQPDANDLGNLLKDLYKIELPLICRDVAGSLAFSYDLDIITKEEEQRTADIKESLHKQTSTFTDKAIVLFELESPYFDFEPEDIHPLDTMGILYSSMRVSDNWGKLTIDRGGCLVSNNYKYLRITAKGYKAEKNHISGDGWHLIIADGWELVEMNQNYLVRKRL